MKENKSNGKKINNSGFFGSIKVKKPKTAPNYEEKTRAGHGERGPLERGKDSDLVSEEDRNRDR